MEQDVFHLSVTTGIGTHGGVIPGLLHEQVLCIVGSPLLHIEHHCRYYA